MIITKFFTNLFMSHNLIDALYGKSISMYFDFIFIMILFNSILLLLQSINYIPYLIFEWNSIIPQIYTKGYIFPFLLTSSYSYKMIELWRLTNSICIIISFMLPFIYLIYTKANILGRKNIIETEIIDIIDDNKNITTKSRVLRLLFSYFIFIICLIISLIINTTLSLIQNYQPFISLVTNWIHINEYFIYTGISIITGVILYIIHIIWDYINIYLTNFERHKTRSDHRNSSIFKVIMFRMINAWITILIKMLLTNQCLLEQLGIQVFSFILVDLFWNNFLEIFVPFIKHCLCKCIGYKQKLNEFDVTEEYYEIIYRQFIIYIGMTAYPYITLFGLVSTIVELFIDKVKLTMLSNVVQKETSNMYIIMFGLFLAASMALFNPTSGNVYTLIGYYWCTGSNCKQCPIFQKQCLNSTCII